MTLLDADGSTAHVVITSYGLALRDRELLADQGFGLLVLDEAQQIRNAQAKTTRAIKSLPIERHGDLEKQRRLAAAVSPFLLRRRKEDVATDLPPKSEMVREVRLNEAQTKLYENIRLSMQKRVRKALQAKGLAQSRVTVLDALLK